MDCVDIYNTSITQVLELVRKKYNINDNNMIDNYSFFYKKRVTGYLLFVKEQYDNCKPDEKCNSSIISKRWKSLSKEEKQVYTKRAKKLSNTEEEKEESLPEENTEEEIVKKPETKRKHSFLSYIAEQNINNNNLYRITLKEKEYIIDCFKNIIDIKGDIGKDIGFIDDDDNIILY